MTGLSEPPHWPVIPIRPMCSSEPVSASDGTGPKLQNYTRGVDGGRLSRVAAGGPNGTDLTFGASELADQHERNAIVDAVAQGAATGSTVCLDALLALIDEQRLDRTSIRKLIVNDHDADDVHQDVLIAVARSIQNFRGDASFNTWLYAVARNTAASHLRRQRDTQALADGDDAITTAQRVSSMIATRSALRDAVDALPVHYRDPVVLRDVEQLSYEQIADRLGINLNTVKSRLSRGRAMVATGLDDSDFAGVRNV